MLSVSSVIQHPDPKLDEDIGMTLIKFVADMKQGGKANLSDDQIHKDLVRLEEWKDVEISQREKCNIL